MRVVLNKLSESVGCFANTISVLELQARHKETAAMRVHPLSDPPAHPNAEHIPSDHKDELGSPSLSLPCSGSGEVFEPPGKEMAK